MTACFRREGKERNASERTGSQRKRLGAECGWHWRESCARAAGAQDPALRSERSELIRRRMHRPLHGGWHRRAGCARAAEAQDPRCGVSEANDAKGGKGAASARLRASDRTRTHSPTTFRDPGKKKPGHPRGAGSARAIGRTGQRAGRPGPDGVNQLHPVVSPQFSHLWQVPLRTVSQPQRGQGGASGVELSRR